MCGSTLPLTAALHGEGGQRHDPGRFTPPRERPGTHYRRLGGSQGRSGRVWKISPLPRFDPPTVQSVTSHIPSTLTRRTLQMGGESLFSQNFCLYSSLETNFMDG